MLCGHTESVSCLAWSPDDQTVLTCGNDRTIKLWLVSTAECVRTFAKHAERVAACAWFPCGNHFVSAGIDKHVHLWSVQGVAIQSWLGPRVLDILVIATRYSSQHK